MKKNRIVGIVVVFAIAAGLFLVRAKRVRQKEGAPLAKEVPVAVQTARVVEGQVVRSRHVLGTVIGAEETSLAPQVMARVLEVNVREGAVVQTGQVLARLGYCQLAAPTNGVVARRLADPGDLAVPGKPLLQLVSQQTVRVRASLPPEDFTGLHLGQPVTLKTDRASVDATVSRVFPRDG